MKYDRPLGKVPELTQLGGHARRRRRGMSLLAVCLLAAVIGGPASWAGGIRQESSPATQVHRSQLAAFAVGSTTQTIAFAQPPDTKVGSPVTVSAPTSSGLEAAFTSNTLAVCTVSGSTVTTVTAGVCAITASQGGDATYAPAPEVARSFQVTTGQATQTITFTPPADTTAGASVSLSASAAPDPALAVSFTSDTPQVCTVSGSTVQTVTAGTCTITASQSGSATYAAAPEVARSFQVTTGQATQTITFTQPADMTAGVQVSMSAPTSSGLEAMFASSTPAVCTVSGSTVQTVTGGTCTITASQGGSATYAAAAGVTQSFKVKTGPNSQTISFTPPPEVVQSGVPVGEPVALSATATSGLPVSFTSDTPQVCTVSGSTVLTVARGTCVITATQGGSEIYQPASQGCIEITERAAAGNQGCFEVYTGGEPQTINFSQPPDTQVGVPVTLLASATSGLPVSFTSSTPRVCTVAGSTVLTVATGMCMITASQSGNKIYAPAQAQRRFTVKLGQTITFAQPPDTQVNAHVPLTATASSELQVLFASSTTDVCTVSGATATTLTVGTCAITATQDGNDIWAPAGPVQRSFTVTKAGQTITFDPPPDAQVHAHVTLSAKATPSRLQVSFASSTTAVCTAADSTVTTVAPGTCTITATQNGNDTWAPARPVQHSFKVNAAGKKSQTIDFAQPSPAAVGKSVALSASASSGLAVSFTSSTTAVCTAADLTVTTVAPGTCTITAAQNGNADYAPAPDVTRSFPVNPAGQKPQRITFAPPKGTKVGEPVALSASASSGLLVSFASNTPAICTVAGSTVTPVAAGTCMITASQSGDASYAPAPDVPQSFAVKAAGQTVNPARHKSQTITFTPPPETTAGEPAALSASASSGLPVSYASNTPAVCAVAGSTVTTMAGGACMITASQGGNTSYAPAREVTRSFRVDPAGQTVNPAGHKSQTITFDPPSQAKAGESGHAVGVRILRAAGGIYLGYAAGVQGLGLNRDHHGGRRLHGHRLPGRRR